MNPIEFMKANGLDPEDYKAAPTVAVQDKRPVIARKRGTVHLVKQRRSRRQIGDVRKSVINEWFETGNPDMTGIFVPYLMLDVMQIVASEHLAKVDFKKRGSALLQRYDESISPLELAVLPRAYRGAEGCCH